VPNSGRIFVRVSEWRVERTDELGNRCGGRALALEGFVTGARDPERRITYEGLRRSTSNMFPAELISRLKARREDPIEWAKDYWKMVSEACEVAWNEHPREVEDDDGDMIEVPVDYRLKDLVGVASLAKLGKDLITSALEHANPNKWLASQLAKLSDVDWEKRQDNAWMRSQAGFAGQKDLYTTLYRLVYLDREPTDALVTEMLHHRSEGNCVLMAHRVLQQILESHPNRIGGWSLGYLSLDGGRNDMPSF
jgi:hypothetical protein